MLCRQAHGTEVLVAIGVLHDRSHRSLPVKPGDCSRLAALGPYVPDPSTVVRVEPTVEKPDDREEGER